MSAARRSTATIEARRTAAALVSSRLAALPEIITHNFDPARGACRNICTLPKAEAAAILDDIRASGARAVKANYLERRLATEDWLIAERRKKLGPTLLQSSQEPL